MSALEGSSLLDFLDAPVVVGDPIGRVIYVNAAFEKAFRCEGEDVSGRDLATVFSGGAREAVLKAVASVCSGGQTSMLRVREDGRGYLGKVSAIETGTDRVGVIILLADEPEPDERLVTYHREMDEPLSEVEGALLELLEETGGRCGDRYRGLAEQALSALQRAGKWSQELSSLLKGEQVSQHSDGTLDPARVLRDVRNRVAEKFEAAEVDFELLARAQLPATRGDGELLQTALTRLLLHRLAGVRGGSFVTLSARPIGKGKQAALLISVIDPLRGGRAAGAEIEAEPRSVRENISVIGGRVKTYVDVVAGRATVIVLPLAKA